MNSNINHIDNDSMLISNFQDENNYEEFNYNPIEPNYSRYMDTNVAPMADNLVNGNISDKTTHIQMKLKEGVASSVYLYPLDTEQSKTIIGFVDENGYVDIDISDVDDLGEYMMMIVNANGITGDFPTMTFDRVSE